MRHRRLIPGQDGLSLVETLAALTIFAVITVGLVPLLGSSLRGTASARAETVGKNVAVEAMERIRGLPFAISYGAQPANRKVDVLDIYFPCADPAGTNPACAGEGTRSYNATNQTYTIVCPAGVSGPACTVARPAGYSVTFLARFVAPNGTASITPPATYVWNSTTGLDSPPSQLLDVTVTTNWTALGRPRQTTIRSLVGDRKFGTVSVAAQGKISHGVQALTRFASTLGTRSDLRLTAGFSESSIETRLVGSAQQKVRAGEVRLIEEPTLGNPNGLDLVNYTGAVSEYRAPPTATSPATNGSAGDSGILTHPGLVGFPQIAQMQNSTATNVEVAVESELPRATGRFDFTTESGNLGFVWAQNQADTGSNTALKLDGNRKIFSIRQGEGTRMSGATAAVTTALGGADRMVEATASLDIREIRLFPVTYISGDAAARRNVLRISNFNASVTCRSTASGATAIASAQWSADIVFWRATGVGDNAGEFVSVSVSGASGDTTLQDVLEATPGIATRNPRVYRALLPSGDLYLFREGLNNGYFTDFSMKAPTVDPITDGKSTRATVEEAMTIATVPTSTTFQESGLVVSVGKLSCDALDAR